MKVPDLRRNLVPDTWTADGEGVNSKKEKKTYVSSVRNTDTRRCACMLRYSRLLYLVNSICAF